MIILKREKEDLEEILEKEKEMLIECQNINQMLVVRDCLKCRKNTQRLRRNYRANSLDKWSRKNKITDNLRQKM